MIKKGILVKNNLLKFSMWEDDEILKLAIPWGPIISVHPWSKIVFIFSA